MGVLLKAGEPWNGDEDAYLEAHWGYRTDREIGAALGRTETAVTHHRSELRLLRALTGDKGNGTRQWRQEEDELLDRLFVAGAVDADIAVSLGRTLGAVAQRRSSLGLRRRDQPEHLRAAGAWSAEEDQVLGWMFRRDWSDEQIGASMERTATAIKDRRQSLGLWRAPRR